MFDSVDPLGEMSLDRWGLDMTEPTGITLHLIGWLRIACPVAASRVYEASPPCAYHHNQQILDRAKVVTHCLTLEPQLLGEPSAEPLHSPRHE